MRSLAIAALLLLALAGLALPTATADTAPVPSEPAADSAPCACPPPPPPPRCPAFDTVGPIAEVVRLAGDPYCNVTVYVLPAIGCAGDPLDGAKSVTVGKATVVLPCGQIDPCEAPFDCAPASAQPPLALCNTPDLCNDAGCPYPVGSEDGTDVQVGPVPVHSDCGPQDLCSGPFRCTSPFGGMSAAIPPVCIQREANAGAVKAGVDSCREDHEDTTCSNGSPQRIHYYVQEGPAYAQVHACLPHTPPPGASTSSAQALPVEVHVVPSQDPVHVDVFVKADVMDCLWGEGYNPTPLGPAATLWVWGCRSPYPPPTTASSSLSAPPCICPPPRPLCYEVNRAIAWGDPIQVDDWCNATVNLTVDCGEGVTPIDHQQKASRVTVNYQTCSQWQAASSASLPDAIPPCQCAPAPLCEPIVELLAPGEGPVTYTLNEYCAATVTVDVTQVADCVYGTHKTLSRGPVTVIYPVCSSPCGPGADYCPPPADVGTTAPNYCEVKEDTPTSVGPVPLNLRAALWGSDCYVDVDPVAACAPPSGFVVERIVGPVHLHLLVCDGGLGQRVSDILEAIGPVEA
jgi:hypothetical protein